MQCASVFCLQCASVFCLQCASVFCLQCASVFCLQCAVVFCLQCETVFCLQCASVVFVCSVLLAFVSSVVYTFNCTCSKFNFVNSIYFVCGDVPSGPPYVHSACRREENGDNLDICVLRRLRQGQMQGFLGLKVGGGGVLICIYGI